MYPLYEIDIRLLKEKSDLNDSLMLDYLKDYVPSELWNLYNEVKSSNDEYTKLKSRLLEELGLDDYLDKFTSYDRITSHGYIEGEIIADIPNIKFENSYTIARVLGYGYSVELHYCKGKSAVEYGYRVTHDCWECEVENIDWYNLNMSENEILDRLFELYDEQFGIAKYSDLENTNEKKVEEIEK